MKVLFAVNNEKISEAIMKRYQKDYKEIISGKNVYYFNAILKELQKDKSYDRIIISEDLEPFSNNNYEAIDKFIYDKLDTISDEAFNSEGANIPIILIGTDRRTKPEPLLVRLFGIGVYDALIGQDRSVEKVCELINRPRSKKEAKIYYKIGNDNFEYKQEKENSVSEEEIQNILSHYKKIGKNQEKYVESFNSIAEQYNNEQLKVIISFLPKTVTTVLSEESNKYKQVMGITKTATNSTTNKKNVATKKQNNQQIEFIEKELKKQKLTKPVIIPTTVDTSNVKKVEDQQEELLKKEKERKAQITKKRAELKKQKELEKQEELRKQEEEKRKQEELRKKEEEKRRQEELRKQEEEKRRQEELRKQKEEKRRQEELRKKEEEKRRQEELRKQEEEKRRQEELRKQEEEKRKQEESRKQEEKKKKRGRPSKEELEDEEDDDDDLPNVDKIAADEPIKRRGRPAKKKVENKNSPITEESEDNSVKKSNKEDNDEEDIFLEFDDVKEDNKILEDDDNEEDDDILLGFEDEDEDEEDDILEEDDNEEDDDILLGFEDEDEDEEEDDDDILPGFEDEDEDEENDILEEDDEEDEDDILPGFEDEDEDEEDDILEEDDEEDDDDDILPGFEDDDILPGFEDEDEEDDILEEDDDEEDDDDDIDKLLAEMEDNKEDENAQISNPNFVRMNPLSAQKVEQPQNSKEIENINRINTNVNFNIDNLISSNQKMVAFIGTSKNGTSFLVNNLAEMLSQKGIKTAILDLTKNRNAYYIYTDNQEERKMIAHECINGLKNGVAQGIKVNKNLDVYTTLPDEMDELGDITNIVPTLLNNYSLVLLDCDFETEYQYFNVAQEIYLVQSMDILTIQPLTAFLRELKAKGILDPNKLRVVVNKYMKLKQITDKAVIGGMSLYNDPSMSFMTELFNVNTVKSVLIPFEPQIYAKYLDSLYDGKITVKGYSKNFIQSLEKLGNMVFPLINGSKKSNTQYANNYNFSSNTNNTLDKMKNKY